MKLVELNKKEQDEIILFLSDFVVEEKQGGEGAREASQGWSAFEGEVKVAGTGLAGTREQMRIKRLQARKFQWVE